MADATRSIAIRLSLMQDDSKIKTPDLSATKAAAADVAQTNAAAAKATEDALKGQNEELTEFLSRLDEAVDAEKSHKSIIEQQTEARRIYNQSVMQGAEAINKIGEGVFKVTRGAALLSGAAGDDLQALVNKVAKAQAAYDLFKGSKDVITGAAKALQIMADGAKAAAVAQGTLTAAQAASNTMAARGVVIQTALTAAMGPLGLTILAITAAVAVGVAVWSHYNAEADKAAKKFSEFQAKQAGFVAGKGAAQFADIGSAARNTGLDDTKAGLVAERDGLDIAKQQVAVNERLAALKAAQAKLAIIERQEQGEESGERLTKALQGQLEIEKAKLSIQMAQRKEVESTLKSKQQELDAQKSIVKTAEEALKKERERLRDLDAGLGKLNDIERAELKRLGDKVKGGGTLTGDEAERVEKLGGSVGQDYAKRFFAKRGQDAGGAQSLLSPFQAPGDKPLTGEGSEEDKLAKDLEAAKEKAKALTEAVEVLRRQDATLVDGLIKIIDQTRERQDQLQRDIEATQANFAAQNAARGGVL